MIYINITAKQGVETQLDLLLCTRVSTYLNYFFFSNIKFAECTRRVYHLGYRFFFLGVGGRGCVRKLLPINEDCLDLIQNIKLDAILELT